MFLLHLPNFCNEINSPPHFQSLTLPLVTLILLFSFYQDDTTDVVAPDSGRLIAGIFVDDVSSGLFRKRFQSLNPVQKAIVLGGFHVWLVALDLMHRQVRQSKTTATMMVSFGKAIGDVSGHVGHVKESSGVLKVNAMEGKLSSLNNGATIHKNFSFSMLVLGIMGNKHV